MTQVQLPTKTMDLPPSLMGRVRTSLFGSESSDVLPEKRGFLAWENGPSVVEGVGGAFLRGYSTGLSSKNIPAALTILGRESDTWRGFAVEGLGMAAGVRDAFRIGSPNFRAALALAGEEHAYMLYVGLGWAWARTPRSTWPSFRSFDPLLATLALDGFGFHEVFFHTRRTLDRRIPDFPLSRWPDGPDDATQGLLQGVGRGLWFVVGGSPTEFVSATEKFDPAHHPSLWAGAGLASTYAGGAPRDVLERMVELAGPHRRWLMQGSAFALEARSRAGNVVEHNQLAAGIYCGRPVDEVCRITWNARPASHERQFGLSAAARWREAIAVRLESA